MVAGLRAERNHAERRKAGDGLRLLGSADSVVHIFQQEREADAGDYAEHERESEIARNVWFARSGGNARGIDDAEVIGAQSGGDASFLQLFQQSFIESAVAVDVALEQAVFDRALVELVCFLLLLLEGLAQHGSRAAGRPDIRPVR